MKATAMIVVASALVAQALDSSVRDLLKNPRQLERAEISLVLAASRQAVAGKTYRLSTAFDDAAGRPGTEVVMGPRGRPVFVRSKSGVEGGTVSGVASGSSAPPVTTRWRVDIVMVTEFTGRPARTCNGAPTNGELIIQYRDEGTGWTASANTRPYPGFPTLFDMLAGDVPVESGNVQQIGDRTARAFVAPWVLPTSPGTPQLEIVTGDPLPNVPRNPPPNHLTQSLWIDTDSLLPLRWDVMYAASSERGIQENPYNRLSFRYDASIALAAPAGVQPPDCVR